MLLKVPSSHEGGSKIKVSYVLRHALVKQQHEVQGEQSCLLIGPSEKKRVKCYYREKDSI